MLIIVMLSFSLAFWFGQLLENLALGFGIVGGIYLIVFILYLVSFKGKIDEKVKDAVIKNAFKSESEEAQIKS